MNEETMKKFVLGEVPDVTALLGSIERQERGYHRCKGPRCDDASHRPNPKVFISDDRPGGSFKVSVGVAFYCEPSAECREAYVRRNGQDREPFGDFALATLRLISWEDGITVLIGSPRCGIGQTFLAWSRNPWPHPEVGA